MVCFALSAWAAPVYAGQPVEAPTAAERATARNLMDVGDQKRAAGDLSGALEAYSAADAIMKVPTTGLDVGKTQAELGLLVEAADTLLRVTRYPRRADEPAPFTKARAEASDLVPEIVERTPTVTIRLEGLPEGTPPRLRIDGKLAPASMVGLPHKVNPGAHLVAAGTPGLYAEREVSLAEGEHQTLTLELSPGEAPEDFYGNDEAPAAEQASESPLVWVGFGVGAAGLAVGTITGILALSQESDLESTCPNQVCGRDADGDLDAAYTMAHVSTVGFIVGGVGVAVGLVALFIGGSGGDDEVAVGNVRVSPRVGPGFVGLEGRF
jgi:hypothetical protein